MSLLVWAPLNRDLNNHGILQSYFTYVNNNGKLTISNTGKIGKCYERTASGYADLYRHSTNLLLDNDITMCCWAYVTSANEAANGLITNHNHTNNSGVGITVKNVSSTDYRICCNTGNGSTRTYDTYYGTTNIKDAWHHLALTYSKSRKQLLLYVDGVVEYTLNNYNNASADNPFDLFNWSTGYYTSGNYRPVCKLNDVRVYDEELSIRQIKEIAKGLLLHFPLDNNGQGRLNLLPSTSITSEITSTYPSSSYKDLFSVRTTVIPTASQYTLSFYAKSTVKGDRIRTHFYSPNTTTRSETNQGVVQTSSDGYIYYTLDTVWRKYWCVYTQSSTTSAKAIICPRLFAGEGSGTVTVKGVKLEEGNKATAWNDGNTITSIADTSGYLFFGTPTSITNHAVPNSPRYSCSTEFNGTGYFTTYCYEAYGTGDFTLSAWIYIKQTSGATYQLIVGNKMDTAASLGFALYFNQSQNKFLWSTGDGTNATEVWSANTFSDIYEAWHHIVMVRNNSDAKKGYFYLDGVRKELASVPAIRNVTNFTTQINVGKNTTASSTYRFTGYLSDVRVYGTALSESAIKELYNVPISIANNGTILTQGNFEEI